MIHLEKSQNNHNVLDSGAVYKAQRFFIILGPDFKC